MAGEGPDVRLPGMNATPTYRRRPTETVREADRLSRSIAVALGQSTRGGRVRLHMTQRQLAARIGVHQSWISRIELGRGHVLALQTWIAIGVAIGQPLAVAFSRPLGGTREPRDAGHLAMQERLLTLARETGRTAWLELATRPTDPARSIDVCVRDARHRVLIIAEAWNTFADVGAAARSTARKRAEAADLAATIDDGTPYRVASVWVVRPSAANRALLARFPGIFAAACPGSSRGWTRALTSAVASPTAQGLVWLDPVTGRVTAWRRRPV
jgi:transcriptional regulator with XRE-family HTH domain